MDNYTVVNLKEIEDSVSARVPEIEGRFARSHLGSEHLGVSFFGFAPGFRASAGHHHVTQEEAYVVVGGSGRMLLDGEVRELRAWDVVRVSPPTVRAFEAGARRARGDRDRLRPARGRRRPPGSGRVARMSLPERAQRRGAPAGVRCAAAVAGRGARRLRRAHRRGRRRRSADSRRSAWNGPARRRVAAEAAWARGEARPLEGIPFGVKDLFDSEGVRTAYGSPMFDANVPARDAEAVGRARAAGAILVGKTQTHEFAWGITSVNELLGSARNPWALDRVSGGSSGGSAVVLAAGEVPLALGSDTGGSIRVPAAFCGIVGLKPTYGRISAARAWPLARSLDHPGPMATTPADAALLLEAIAGVDAADPATVDVPLGDVQGELRRGLAGLVVGICADLELVPLAADVRDVCDGDRAHARPRPAPRLVEVGAAGGRADPADVPDDPERRGARHAPARPGLFPARRGEYGADVLGRLDAAERGDARAVPPGVRRPRARPRRVRAPVPARATCCSRRSARGSPLPIGEETVVHEGVELTFRDLVMSYTTPQDLVGLPACAVRAGFDALGIPVGVQFTAPPWQEGRVLRAAQGLFDATPEMQAKRPVALACEGVSDAVICYSRLP